MAIIEIKNVDVSFIILGSLIIAVGISIDYFLPWTEEISHNKIEKCIADMHFRNSTETQFQECVSTDLKQIEAIQKLNVIISVLYSMGGVFVGFGFITKVKSKKLVNKPDICNCGTVFRCPIHDK